MRLQNVLIFDVALIAAACLIPLAPVIAQTRIAQTGITQTGSPGPAPGEGAAQRAGAAGPQRQGFNVPQDGVMGGQTVAALRAYQQQHGLPPTGRIDPQPSPAWRASPRRPRNRKTFRRCSPGMAPPSPPPPS